MVTEQKRRYNNRNHKKRRSWCETMLIAYIVTGQLHDGQAMPCPPALVLARLAQFNHSAAYVLAQKMKEY